MPAAPATITIVKVTQGHHGDWVESTTPVSFGGDRSFTLDTAPWTSTPQSVTFHGVTPGEFVVTEAVPPGWYLKWINCGFGPVRSVPGGVAVTLEPGDHVMCTFKNTEFAPLPQPTPKPPPGSLTVAKVTQGAGGGWIESDTTFWFGGDVSFGLDTAPWTAKPSSRRIDGLAPGEYRIVESVPAGWFVKWVRCGSAPVRHVANGVIVTVGPGHDVACTFKNSEHPK